MKGFGHFLADAFVGQLTSITRMLAGSVTLGAGIVLGLRIARWLVPSWGAAGRVVGAVTGMAIVLVIVWAIALGRILLLFPFPTCRRGRCRTIDDYVWDMGAIYGRGPRGVYAYTCGCGDRYERVGRTLFAVDADGGRTVFKKMRGLRTWEDAA